MKKYIKRAVAAVVVVGAFVAYIFGFGQKGPSTSAVTPIDQGQNSVATSTKAVFNDGSYTGVSTNVFYGNVQVKVIVANGKLSDVVFLQYPNDRNTSIVKSNMAMPILRSEAIAAQSAQVDVVSGATQTSEGFVASMQSALQQAKA